MHNQRTNKSKTSKTSTKSKPKNTWTDTCEEIDQDQEMALETTREEPKETHIPLVSNKPMNQTATEPEKQSFSNDYDPKEQNNPDVTKGFPLQTLWPEEIEMSSSL